MIIKNASFNVPGFQFRVARHLLGWDNERACLACNISLDQLHLVERHVDNLTEEQFEKRAEAGVAMCEGVMLSGMSLRRTESQTHYFYDCVLPSRPREEVVLVPGLISPRLMAAFRHSIGLSLEQFEKVVTRFGLIDAAGFESLTRENVERYHSPSVETLKKMTVLMREMGVFIIDETFFGLPEWGLRLKVDKVGVNG